MFSFLNFLLNIVNLFLLLSILRTTDNNQDFLLDLERNCRRLEKLIHKKGKK